MVIQSGSALYGLGTGQGVRYQDVEIPVIANRDPAPTDVKYPIGKRWINSLTSGAFELTGQTALGGQVQSVWAETAGEAVAEVLGTANQISVSTTNRISTLSLPTTLIAPGTFAAQSDIEILGVGGKLKIAVGADGSLGTVFVSGASVTVQTTAVTTNSKIFLTVEGPVAFAVSVNNVVNGVSFDIVSGDPLQSSNVDWLIIN